MALSVTKALGALAMRSTRGVVGAVAASAPKIHRGFTRSMWHMSRSAESGAPTLAPSTHSSLRCSCCGLHTDGDKNIGEFLKGEIKLEKDSSNYRSELPTVKGFEVSLIGTNVTLTKSNRNEKTTIKFNINDSVDDESQYFDDEGDNPDNQAQMVSRPPLHIEINKGGEKRIAFHCHIPQQLPEEKNEEQEYEDLLQIQDFAMLRPDEEWNEDTFTVSAALIDGDLYAMLLHMLEERGVDGDFVDEVVKLSTVAEHKAYLKFLSELQKFVSQ